MPRPRKPRHVCCVPEIREFQPAKSNEDPEVVRLSLDEFETIRLLDHRGFTQEECAKQMQVARTTVQGIYDVARKKIASAIVEGKRLLIDGGEYELCDTMDPPSIYGGCNKKHHQRHS